MIELYITHYVTEKIPGYNDILIDCLDHLKTVAELDGDIVNLAVVYWASSDALEREIHERAPRGVGLFRRESGVQPYLMNQATELAKERGAEFFLCLHNDIRPTRGWLRNILSDVRAAEAIYGRGNVVVTPRYIPYHWVQPSDIRHPAFWDRIRPEVEGKVLSHDAMRAWCHRYHFAFDGVYVRSPQHSFTTDDGHQLMMYCAAPEFFDAIGGCDETFTGLNYGDCDWGIRALKAGKKNMLSQGSLLGHISGLTFFNPAVHAGMDDNHQRFIAKWGEETWRKLQDGSIWTELHRAQR